MNTSLDFDVRGSVCSSTGAGSWLWNLNDGPSWYWSFVHVHGGVLHIDVEFHSPTRFSDCLVLRFMVASWTLWLSGVSFRGVVVVDLGMVCVCVCGTVIR